MSVASALLRLGGGVLRRRNPLTPATRSLVSFRSFTAKTQDQQQQKRETPYLLLSSPIRPDTRYLVDANDYKIVRELHLPAIAGHNFVGSSQGFLFSVDPSTADIHATNPFTGATIPLPPTVSFPDIHGVLRDPASGKISDYIFSYSAVAKSDLKTETLIFESNKNESFPITTLKDQSDHDLLSLRLMRYYCTKVILSPSLDVAVAISSRVKYYLSFARIDPTLSSSPVSSWSALESPITLNFEDVIFHQGRLHAVNRYGILVIFDMDDLSGVPTIVPRVEEDDESDESTMRMRTRMRKAIMRIMRSAIMRIMMNAMTVILLRKCTRTGWWSRRMEKISSL